MRVLGLDPGSRCCGFAWAEFQSGQVAELELGSWILAAETRRERALALLAEQSETWIRARVTDVAVVESLFQHRNARSALVLAEARGVLLSVLGRIGVPLVEYPPATIKKTICGFGGAGKEQVRDALMRTVPGLARFDIARSGLDATDALAAAVCHHARCRYEALAGLPR
ncbi:MAG: crossover junction endodeoxyribonuclease RuvC [Acidobacteria bacterium]|nr:crossover junction endodeoxyribonuclease RuvC [Acidobacteriota bacterium]